MIFGHLIYFGHFPIEIPIEAEKYYHHGKELSYRENKICSETNEVVGTIWEHAQKEFQKFLKIRITLIPHPDAIPSHPRIYSTTVLHPSEMVFFFLTDSTFMTVIRPPATSHPCTHLSKYNPCVGFLLLQILQLHI